MYNKNCMLFLAKSERELSDTVNLGMGLGIIESE